MLSQCRHHIFLFMEEIQTYHYINFYEPKQHFLGNPESGHLKLEAHQLTLAIAKKTLDDNHFRNVQKTMDRKPPSFQLGDRVYFKNKQPGKWDLKWRPGYRIFILSVKDTTCTSKTRSWGRQGHAM